MNDEMNAGMENMKNAAYCSIHTGHMFQREWMGKVMV